MSHCQSTILSRADVPDRASMQNAIDAIGFNMKIDESYEPFGSSGFLPCTLNGQPSGVEIFWEPLHDILAAWPNLKELVAERDSAMTFVLHSDMSELVCALVLSAALCISFGAVSFYQDDNTLSSASELIEEARQAEKRIKR